MFATNQKLRNFLLSQQAIYSQCPQGYVYPAMHPTMGVWYLCISVWTSIVIHVIIGDAKCRDWCEEQANVPHFFMFDKSKLAERIRSIEGLSADERSALLELLNNQKKYGLVWEEKPEEVEEQLQNQLPVLTEVVEKRIIGAQMPSSASSGAQPSLVAENNNSAPNHILIEGDNLHALTCLSYTHEGKIDVIYIDPPYNTGNKDFVYNDRFVDTEDAYRHSKWLSFMPIAARTCRI